MTRLTHQRLCGLSLAALLLLPALPAAADRAVIELHLEQALALQPLELDAKALHNGEVALAPEPQQPTATVNASDLRASAWKMSEQTAAQADPMPAKEKRGFGRWLKKRWYVAALVAIAVGAAVGDSGDNDRGGEED